MQDSGRRRSKRLERTHDRLCTIKNNLCDQFNADSENEFTMDVDMEEEEVQTKSRGKLRGGRTGKKASKRSGTWCVLFLYCMFVPFCLTIFPHLNIVSIYATN